MSLESFITASFKHFREFCHFTQLSQADGILCLDILRQDFPIDASAVIGHDGEAYREEFLGEEKTYSYAS